MGHPAAAVAATIVQWLGTNCGYGFLQSVEKAIDDARGRADAKFDARIRRSLETDRREQQEERQRGMTAEERRAEARERAKAEGRRSYAEETEL